MRTGVMCLNSEVMSQNRVALSCGRPVLAFMGNANCRSPVKDGLSYSPDDHTFSALVPSLNESFRREMRMRGLVPNGKCDESSSVRSTNSTLMIRLMPTKSWSNCMNER